MQPLNHNHQIVPVTIRSFRVIFQFGMFEKIEFEGGIDGGSFHPCDKIGPQIR